MSNQPKRGPRTADSKIPFSLRDTVWRWKQEEGLSNEEVIAKLRTEHDLTISKKPLSRLMQIMRQERSEIISNAMTEQAATQIEQDFKLFRARSTALEKEFYEAMKEDEDGNKNLSLAIKINDQLTDMDKVKFAIASNSSARDADPVRHRNELLEGMLSKAKEPAANSAATPTPPLTSQENAGKPNSN